MKKKSEMTPEQVAEWIWSRCHEDGDCLIWDGAIAGKSGPAVTSPFTGKTAPARRVLMQALGRQVNGFMCTTSCGSPNCMAKAHLITWTRKQLQKRTGKVLSTNEVRRSKLAAAAQRRSPLTMEMVREMRASGMTATQAAAHYGVPFQTAARALRNGSFRDYSSPFAGLLAANDSRRNAA